MSLRTHHGQTYLPSEPSIPVRFEPAHPPSCSHQKLMRLLDRPNELAEILARIPVNHVVLRCLVPFGRYDYQRMSWEGSFSLAFLVGPDVPDESRGRGGGKNESRGSGRKAIVVCCSCLGGGSEAAGGRARGSFCCVRFAGGGLEAAGHRAIGVVFSLVSGGNSSEAAFDASGAGASDVSSDAANNAINDAASDAAGDAAGDAASDAAGFAITDAANNSCDASDAGGDGDSGAAGDVGAGADASGLIIVGGLALLCRFLSRSSKFAFLLAAPEAALHSISLLPIK
ncbi:hypothetical protein BDV95DRAFT_599822 [Massariosphaeria phaeospora]|uniref:Uncharacterized protein n=1 Tax=Massariosphaeria phaeospora TaxID=100035 RepID=A0A7C8M016_9PLEO|nr:hypothetical protein BDV95DRAFT_599822 [Massariosphaeria phaeospora]